MNPSVAHFMPFCPPSEFAFAHKTETAFAHPLLPIARQRASTLSTNVLLCAVILSFARTYFENNS